MKKLFNIILLISVFLLMSFLNAKTKENYYTKIIDMGYKDVNKTPSEIVEFTIPKEFNNVYTRYNKLQKEGGYDLSLYKGKKCLRYTYPIPSLNARANVIVYNGKIIGGDISGITIDGIMIPLSPPDERRYL